MKVEPCVTTTILKKVLKRGDNEYNKGSMAQQFEAYYLGNGIWLKMTCMDPIGFNNLPKKG